MPCFIRLFYFFVVCRELKNNLPTKENEKFSVKIDVHSVISDKVEIDSYFEDFPVGYELEKSIRLNPKCYGRINFYLHTDTLENIEIEYCHLEFISE